MVWAVITAAGRSALVFVPSGVKINSELYISDILEAELLPWAHRWCSMDLPARLCSISWLKNYSKLEPGLRSIISEQTRMTIKEPSFEPSSLFGLGYIRQQGMKDLSDTLDTLNSKFLKRMGLNSSRNTACLL